MPLPTRLSRFECDGQKVHPITFKDFDSLYLEWATSSVFCELFSRCIFELNPAGLRREKTSWCHIRWSWQCFKTFFVISKKKKKRKKLTERVISKTLCTCPVLLDYSTAFIFWLWFRKNLNSIHINKRWDALMSYSYVCDTFHLPQQGQWDTQLVICSFWAWAFPLTLTHLKLVRIGKVKKGIFIFLWIFASLDAKHIHHKNAIATNWVLLWRLLIHMKVRGRCLNICKQCGSLCKGPYDTVGLTFI